MFKENNIPWNKGKTGEEAGWTAERKKRHSIYQSEFLKSQPNNPFCRKGPQPQIWMTGPDPKVKAHRLRWNRMKAQAKYWSQEWTISWEDYLDLYKTATGLWGRQKHNYNLTRVDTSQGWHIWNVQMMTRGEAMCRKTKGAKRIQPAGQGSKARGIKWSRQQANA